MGKKFDAAVRRAAERLAAEQAQRLEQGRSVDGRALEPVDEDTARQKVTSRPGVDSGETLRALRSRAAIQVRRDGFRVMLTGAPRRRWELLNRGTGRQPARPVAGIDPRTLKEVVRDLAKAYRDDVVDSMKRRMRR